MTDIELELMVSDMRLNRRRLSLSGELLVAPSPRSNYGRLDEDLIMSHPDRGCKHAPSCLHCQLPECTLVRRVPKK